MTLCSIFLFIIPQPGVSAYSPNSQTPQTPSIEISQPSICTETVEAGKIQVIGTAHANSSAIAKVEVLIDSASSSNDNQFAYAPATPGQVGNWSIWTITLQANETGPYRVVAHVVDKAGNENWKERSIQVTASGSLLEPSRATSGHAVAVLEPIFTEAAYGPSPTEFGNFYAFYLKHNSAVVGTEIKTDLNLLTGKIPDEPDHQFSTLLEDSLTKFDPSTSVSRINDVDVNNGFIFDKNGHNLYDAIFLLHDEYVTQQEYNNYEKFVKNGGTLVPLDGNIFYAEVRYDPQSCTVSLVKGHDWEFDGAGAHKSVSERFADENRKFIGSNFVVNDIKDQESYGNNPFAYTHFEENYINNENDTILVDYNAKIGSSSGSSENARGGSILGSTNIGLIPEDILGKLFKFWSGSAPSDNSDKKLATYELLPFGKNAGKVIMLGLYAQNLLHNEAFVHYLDNVIFPLAFGSSQNLILSGGESLGLHFKVPQRYALNNVTLDHNTRSLNFNITPASNYVEIDSNDSLFIVVLPKVPVGSNSDSLAAGTSNGSGITVELDGTTVPYSIASDKIETGFSIDLSAKAQGRTDVASALAAHHLTFSGASIVPEFASSEAVLVIASLMGVSLVIVKFVKVASRSEDQKG